MGLGLKIGLFLFAVMAAVFGAWIVVLPILVLLFLPPLVNRTERKKDGSKQVKDSRTRRWPLGTIGAVLVFLSSFAFFAGGTFSPAVLLVAGFALLFRNRLRVHISAGFRPVKNSILMRQRLLPFRWSTVAEVKVSTKDLEGALSGLSERLYCISDPKPRIFVVFSENSLSKAKAEETLVRRIQVSARSLYPLGVYLLPVDSADAAELASVRLCKIEPAIENIRQYLSTADYGSAVVEAHHGFVTRFELYSRPDEVSKPQSILSALSIVNTSQLTLREFLHETKEKFGVPQPDRYTAFLSSMAATASEALGQRIIETVGSSEGQALLVASVGNPPVELSRAQLRAISEIYE